MFACTMFLEIDLQNTGWTETWYRSFNTSAAAKAAFVSVANLRFKTLGDGARVLKYRVSDVAVTGDSSEGRDLVVPGHLGDDSVNFASVGYQCRYESNDLQRSIRLLRGLPKKAFSNGNPTAIVDPATLAAVQAYHTALETAYSFRVKKRPPAVVEYVVKTVAFNPVTVEVTLTTLINHNIPAGATVNVTGLRQFERRVSGTKYVTSVGANTITYKIPIGNEVIDLGSEPYNGRGRVKVVEYDYPIIAAVIPQRWTDRQSGRPFEQQVGRR